MKFIIVLFIICSCLIFVCLPGLVLGVTEYIFSVHTFCCCKVLYFMVQCSRSLQKVKIKNLGTFACSYK